MENNNHMITKENVEILQKLVEYIQTNTENSKLLNIRLDFMNQRITALEEQLINNNMKQNNLPNENNTK